MKSAFTFLDARRWEARWFAVALVMVLGLPWVGRPQDQVRIEKIRANQIALTLEWTGNSEFYEIQAATKLSSPDWRTVLRTRTASGEVSISGSAAFYRVLPLPNWRGRIISESRRMAILNAIGQRISSLPQTNTLAGAQALADYLLEFPELEGMEVGSDRSVFAWFTDGRPLVIINNRRSATASELATEYALSSASSAGRPGPEIKKLSARAGVAPLAVAGQQPSAIPRSRQAVLFEATVPGLAAPMLESLAPAFERRGYVVSGGEASLDALLAIEDLSGDIGVFYIDTHGAVGATPRTEPSPGPGSPETLRPVPALFLQTSTIVTEETEFLYGSNFDHGELAYTLGGPGVSGMDPAPRAIYYAVGPEFARNHWRFSRGSLVYVDACLSASAGAASFAQTCLNNNASVYAGWDASVIDGWAYFATRLFFDTSLGGSQIFTQVIPKQRAFDLTAIQRYMTARNYDIDQMPGSDGAALIFLASSAAALPSSFGLLAPSILKMDTGSYRGQVAINGLFDPTLPATVKIEGNGTRELEVTPVSRTELLVPWTGTDQPSAGAVTVLQNGHPSNRVPLSEWRIPARMVRSYSNAQSQPSANIDFQLHVRADVHPSRPAPYEHPFFIATGAVAAPDSTGRVLDVSGQYDEGRYIVEWQLPAPVDLPCNWFFDPLEGSGFKARVRFLGAGEIAFEIEGIARNALTVVITNREGERTESVGNLAGLSAHPNTRGNLDGSYQILPGNDASNPSAIAFGPRLTWGAAAAAFTPDPNQAGYAE